MVYVAGVARNTTKGVKVTNRKQVTADGHGDTLVETVGDAFVMDTRSQRWNVAYTTAGARGMLAAVHNPPKAISIG